MKMLIQIRSKMCLLKKGQVSTAVNVASSTTNITFGWLVDQNVTAIAGDVRFEIMATGTNEKAIHTFGEQDQMVDLLSLRD